MREGRSRRTNNLKLPLIKQRFNLNGDTSIKRGLKLQKINRQRNIALVDINQINKIEKEFTLMTKRKEDTLEQHQPKQDQLRESKLLLLKNIARAPPKKKAEANRLSNLVEYTQDTSKIKSPNIPSSNISVSPGKAKLNQRRKQSERQSITSHYTNAMQLQQADFVKMFIVEELLYYVSKTNQRLKEEMAGFCKFYNDNHDQETNIIISNVLVRSRDYLNSVFLQKLGFYIFLILGTDEDSNQEGHFLLSSLVQYIHTNNLIILDLLMEIIDVEKFPVASQFHVYNTLRFNEDRRKIKHNEDRLNLVAKNNRTILDIINSLVKNCGFQSLKSFIFEILGNEQAELMDKIREVSLMLVSLDSILTSSINQMQAKPQPPFLPPLSQAAYTLVLDMDQTLIHTKQMEESKAVFLVRPYCQEFLTQMAKHYQIVIFTAAVKEYADNILDSIDPQGRIQHRLYRQHTRIEDYTSIKDLSMIGRDLSKCIIIDNIASNFKVQPRNGIAITTWTGEPDDISLLNLMPVLRKLVVEKVNDLRDGLQKLSEFMQNRLSKGQQVVFQDISLKGL